MIAKSNKFPTRQQFLQFRALAKRIVTPHLQLLYLPHTPNEARKSEGGRLSVIVPIKVSKRATTRNSFKRLVYDAAWKMIQDKNLDCIIMFKPIALLKGQASQDLIVSELKSPKFENLRI